MILVKNVERLSMAQVRWRLTSQLERMMRGRLVSARDWRAGRVSG